MTAQCYTTKRFDSVTRVTDKSVTVILEGGQAVTVGHPYDMAGKGGSFQRSLDHSGGTIELPAHLVAVPRHV